MKSLIINIVFSKDYLKKSPSLKGFFQSESFLDKKSLPIIKQEHLQNAHDFLKDIPTNSEKIFVHVRRGDYLDWSVLGKLNPSLPSSY